VDNSPQSTNENHIGANFDDFLADQGMLEEVEAVAVKRVLAYQINELMAAQNISKSEMARRMKTSRAALDRLLDPENRSVTLSTLDRAARSLGRHLRLTLQ
jgi:DNA-binding Xre family transcriptional regulator